MQLASPVCVYRVTLSLIFCCNPQYSTSSARSQYPYAQAAYLLAQQAARVNGEAAPAPACTHSTDFRLLPIVCALFRPCTAIPEVPKKAAPPTPSIPYSASCYPKRRVALDSGGFYPPPQKFSIHPITPQHALIPLAAYAPPVAPPPATVAPYAGNGRGGGRCRIFRNVRYRRNSLYLIGIDRKSVLRLPPIALPVAPTSVAPKYPTATTCCAQYKHNTHTATLQPTAHNGVQAPRSKNAVAYAPPLTAALGSKSKGDKAGFIPCLRRLQHYTPHNCARLRSALCLLMRCAGCFLRCARPQLLHPFTAGSAHSPPPQSMAA